MRENVENFLRRLHVKPQTIRTFAKYCQYIIDSIMMFTERIKKLREIRQLPQRQLAAALEIDTATYCKMMRQLSLFDITPATDRWQTGNFSADNFGEQTARLNLEQKLIDITVISSDFNRQTVSYQLSKNDCLHRWLKYKEGFSADLVKRLLNKFETNIIRRTKKRIFGHSFNPPTYNVSS